MVFDAADFVRCGRDLFVTRSNVTNEAGIRWLRRHLRDNYTIHEITSHARQPMHIDSSIVPLGAREAAHQPGLHRPEACYRKCSRPGTS